MFGHLEKNGFVTLCAGCSKCRTFKVSDTFPRGQPWKTWNEVISLLCKDLAEDRNAWFECLSQGLN